MSHKLSKSKASKARGSNNTCNTHVYAFEAQGFPACHSYLHSSKWVVSHIISDQKQQNEHITKNDFKTKSMILAVKIL